MTSQIHAFTSITNNYIPKARALAKSLKEFHADCTFHLALCDKPPEGLLLANEPFDNLILVEELPIPNVKSWIFKHTLVELCTGVKGAVFDEIFNKFNADKIFYFDPDILIFSKLDFLLEKLDSHSILLTPHQTAPDREPEAIIDNEICSLKHGVYNLGFLGVSNTEIGRKFVKWWAERLYLFCYDDKPSGLFTDQRWIDLAPAFFDDIFIVREPNYNVSTWNLSHRVATGNLEDGIFINAKPLCFYHFSGFDSGDQEIMLKKYGSHSPVLFDLREYYSDECGRLGQEVFGQLKCAYSFFEDGTPITPRQRLLYKQRQDLQEAFSDPYCVNSKGPSYKKWCQESGEDSDSSAAKEAVSIDELKIQLMQAYGELAYIKGSRTWRLTQLLRRLFGRQPMKYLD